MFKPFCSIIGHFMPNLVLCDTSSHEEKIPNHRFSIKPDCTVYDKGNGAVAGTDSSVAEFFLKFKYSSVDDPFVDSPNPRGSDGRTQEGCTFVKDSRAARKLIGQIGTCVAVQMDVQYRTHTFFVLVVGDYARLMRWDRGGAIFTERIYYNKDSELLEFFEAYNEATAEVRGVDQFVTKPTAEEIDAASGACQELRNTPLLVVSFHNPDLHVEPNRYVIKSPAARRSLPVGCSTRTSVAYDIQRKKCVFMKDFWRDVGPDVVTEGQVYQRLNRCKIKSIPLCVDFCDVGEDRYHKSQTCALFRGAAWKPSGFRFLKSVLRHHRLILDTIGKKLEAFSSSREMLIKRLTSMVYSIATSVPATY
ncbi:hypothetical protein BC826DRAFT_60346 [Russula brevipes]|nr:hypothetical protein BC826DRAFT_60346 [Russula brevipes]